MDETRYLMPGLLERKCLETASKDFTKFASITTSLDTKWVFEKLVEDYPVFEKQLGPNSQCLVNCLFEEAVSSCAKLVKTRRTRDRRKRKRRDRRKLFCGVD